MFMEVECIDFICFPLNLCSWFETIPSQWFMHYNYAYI